MDHQEASTEPMPFLAGLNAASTALLVATAPAVGYLLTWVHLLGYANQFDIPHDLIAPQLGDVLATTFGVGIGILMIFSVTLMFETRVLRWSRGNFGPIEGRIGLILIATALALLLAGLSWPSGQQVLVIGVLLVIVVIGAFWPALRTRDGTVRDRLRRADAARREPPPSPMVTELQNRLGAFLFTVALVVFLVGILAYDAGSVEAHTTKDFLVLDGSTPEVVLATYGDTVILASLDRSKRAVTPELVIVKIGTTPLRLHWMSVGPLTVIH
ncbi:MAG TPA: hypothetical protein VEL12_16580 [Candidatus Nitrosopolaris sp.]|nr:hypothetical protein [Candidatus Nitrosopolaris sp.]